MGGSEAISMDDPKDEKWRRLGFRQIEDRFGGVGSLKLQVEFIHRAAEFVLSIREDVRERFGDDPMSADFWCWLNTFGVREFPLVRGLLVPVPPPEVFQFVGSDIEMGFLQTGANGYQMIMDILESQDVSIDRVKCVLDFGSGPGRMARYFLRHWETTGIVGTDVDASAIAWAQKEFPLGEFVVNAPNPPLPLPGNAFDLIYAVSVFSHLSEANHRLWLDELHRVAEENCLLVLTVLGGHALGRMQREESFREWVHISESDLDETATALDEQGFSFVRQDSGHLDQDLYGVAFLTKEYVEREWAEKFEVVDYLEAAIDNNQDAVVLRAR